ncbi:MAG: cobyrinate a,c-diamide synthase [Thermoanaerobacteraceae bacterium]|nr:cobyrinate a,c-diamide synthase [Thermoanaerobacteraceae bacterium]
MIAATHSGAGKTTVATALMAVLTRAGLTVQPYKVGPDYIDPGYHTAATGRVSRNLDAWFLGRPGLTELFRRGAAGADLCLIEGVMGLYDGRGAGEEGSSAQVAKWLSTPVVLVIDARSLARSGAALVLGYRLFDPAVPLAGVLLNRVGSSRHYTLLRKAIEEEAGLPVLGWIGRRQEVYLPERHLGLLPTSEKDALFEHLNRLVDSLGEGVDLKRLVAVARSAPPLPEGEGGIFPAEPLPPAVRIGVVRDAAFHFYYRDGLDLLEALGADLVFLSALEDGVLPRDLDGLYIGGGFPEMFLPRLAANGSFMEDLRGAFYRGMPIYAECGGLMYLCRAIVDFEGREYPMAGLLPGICRMQRRRVALGYVKARVLTGNILAGVGEELRGHEFHYSSLEEMPEGIPRAYLLYQEGDSRGKPDGYVMNNLLASYLHLHLASCPQAAERFLHHCARYKAARMAAGCKFSCSGRV